MKDAEIVVELKDFPQDIINTLLRCDRAVQFHAAEIDRLRKDMLAWGMLRQDQWCKIELWLRERGLTHLDSDGVKRQVKIDFFNRRAYHKTIF